MNAARPYILLEGKNFEKHERQDVADAIREAVNSIQLAGGGSLEMRGEFRLNLQQGDSLIALRAASNILVDASEALIDNSQMIYTADEPTSLILLDGCRNCVVLLGEYRGFELPDPSKHLGYRGATVVRVIGGSKYIKISAKIFNARYGLLTGSYSDPRKGRCSNFDVKIEGGMIGYPIAAYLADEINFSVNVDGIHRAAYFAGCDKVAGSAQWKDQYIADTALLITNALEAGTDAEAQSDPVKFPTKSRGSSNFDVISIDKGSKIYQTSSSCAGIAISRVDPCFFKNITVKVYSKGSNEVSPVVGGWRIVSGAKTVWNRYASNWIPGIVFDGIQISGLIDHSACTLPGNSGSEFYIHTFDGKASEGARLYNLKFDGFKFLPSKGQQRGSYFYAPGLSSPASFKGFHTPGVSLNILTNEKVDSIFEDCAIGDLIVSGVSGGSRVVVGAGCEVESETSNVPVTNTLLKGGIIRKRYSR